MISYFYTRDSSSDDDHLQQAETTALLKLESNKVVTPFTNQIGEFDRNSVDSKNNSSKFGQQHYTDLLFQENETLRNNKDKSEFTNKKRKEKNRLESVELNEVHLQESIDKRDNNKAIKKTTTGTSM